MKSPRLILAAALALLVAAAAWYFLSGNRAPKTDAQNGTPSPAPLIPEGTPPGAEVVISLPDLPDVATAREAASAFPAIRFPAPVGKLLRIEYGEPIEAAGEKAVAHVEASGATFELTPNQLGEFPFVPARANEMVRVHVAWPDAAPGTRIGAAVEDGGKFADGKPVNVLTLDDNRIATFEFVADKWNGGYRITLRKGMDRKIVQVWAGEPRVRRVEKPATAER